MPRPATSVEERFDEVSLPDEQFRPGIPIFNARVVYLGGNPKKSVPLPGQVSVELVESENGTAVRDTGHRLARQLFEKEYQDLTPDERKQVDAQKVARRYKEVKEAIRAGMTSYDFSTHDAAGTLIRERLMPGSAPEHLRGRPWQRVEHGLHAAQFFLMRGPANEKEFEVRVPPDQMAAFSEYVRSVRRGESAEKAGLKEVMTGTRY